MNKKLLYETIIRNVSKEVKKVLNESLDKTAFTSDGKQHVYLHAIKNPNDTKHNNDLITYLNNIMPYTKTEIIVNNIKDKNLLFLIFIEDGKHAYIELIEPLALKPYSGVVNDCILYMKNVIDKYKSLDTDKKSVNESNQLPFIICTPEEEERILDLVHRIGDTLTETGSETIFISEDDFTLRNMTGTIEGDITFYVYIRSYLDWDDPQHKQIEYDVTDYEFEESDLIFNNGDEDYIVYLNKKDYKRKN